MPLEDVEVYDGYILCHLHKCEFVNTPEWEQCKDYLWDDFPKKYFRVFENELTTIFQQQLANIKKLIDSDRTIRINTYLSAKSFVEAISTKYRQPLLLAGTMPTAMPEPPKHITFPVSFFTTVH